MKFLFIHSFPLSWEGQQHFSRLLRDVGIAEGDVTQLTLLSQTPGDGRKKGDFTKLTCRKETALAEWEILFPSCVSRYETQEVEIWNDNLECYLKHETLVEIKEPTNARKYDLPKYRNKFVQPLSVIGDLQKFQLSLDAIRETENITCTIGLGPVACWYLIRDGALDKHRGTFIQHAEIGKILFSFCIEQVFEFYTRNTILMFDIMKVKQDCEKRGDQVYIPDVEFWLEPTLQDIVEFRTKHITGGESPKGREGVPPLIGIDIETRHGGITSISFSTKEKSLVVPFVLLDETSYWETFEEELEAWKWVKAVCECKEIKKVFQNGMYDVQYLFGKYGIRVNGWEHDTMFMAHSKFPELNKDLGTLASFYTNFPSWKYGLAETKVEK